MITKAQNLHFAVNGVFSVRVDRIIDDCYRFQCISCDKSSVEDEFFTDDLDEAVSRYNAEVSLYQYTIIYKPL